MEINENNFQLLAEYLQKTWDADANIRKPAEKFLENIEVNQNYPLLLLNLIDKSDLDVNIRVAGAVAFKNYVKRNWGAHIDNPDISDKVHESDRMAVKNFIIQLMLKSPPQIQKQLSESVSYVGKYDFPQKWPQLIEEIVEKFKTGNFNFINGVLQTAHSLFKRYRHEFKSQKLWEEIKYVLDRICQPITELLTLTLGLTDIHANDKDALKIIYNCLLLMCKIFYSLNSQDLPEFFEDNMVTWMNAFLKLLTTDVQCLQSPDDGESSVIEHLRSQICDNIGLYAHKYDEEFTPYIPDFVTAVWKLLVSTGKQAKYDELVANAMNFLSIVADRHHSRQLFEDPSVLSSICEYVIIPNMDFRTSDEELFEFNPEEYIRRDMEGSDVDTRRRSACDLVKSLCANFESKIVDIFSQFLVKLLGKYVENPSQNWREKDVAIYLVTSLASKGGTQRHGVTQTSVLVPLPDFCQQQIFPELERSNVNELPVLKADAIKFIMTFRNLLGADIITRSLPLIISHLRAENVVCHSYAACALEKILLVRVNNDAMISATLLSSNAEQLFTGFLHILSGRESRENEYVMKAIMRSIFTLQNYSLQYMGLLLPKLTEMLVAVAKNPSKPIFSFYLFESLSISIKVVCSANPSNVASFEEALFPIFQLILQDDVIEFIPFVFQILSLMLEIRGPSEIPEPYLVIFPFLVEAGLYETQTNISPSVRLICTLIRVSPNKIAAFDKLNPLLGVFQKLIASKMNDHEGIKLLQTLILHYPRERINENMQKIFALLFQRLTSSKTVKFVKRLIVFFSFFAAKMGPENLIAIIDGIQNQMFGMVLERLYITDMNKVSDGLERKFVIVGLTKILCECPIMLQSPYVNYWVILAQNLIQMFELPPESDDVGAIEIEDNATFSQLSYAKPMIEDPFAEITDGRKNFIEKLANLANTDGQVVRTAISQLPNDHQAALQRYANEYMVRIF